MGNMRFKAGDRVKIKSLDWYNENKDELGELLDDKRIKTTVENCEHFDACYNIKDKILKIQFYDDKRRLT